MTNEETGFGVNSEEFSQAPEREQSESAVKAADATTAVTPVPLVATGDVALAPSSDEPVEFQVEFELGDMYLKESVKSDFLPLEPSIEARIEANPELLNSMETIPDKMAFKIGEAADFVGVKQYVLRYWETEFEMLKPKKSKNGQRVYSRRDVETAMMIKKLLYDDRFSIEGARAALRQLRSSVKHEKNVKAIVQSQGSAVQKMHALVDEIRRLRQVFA